MEELIAYITTELEKRRIEYMVSGSLAMNAYASARMTRDIDIVIQLNIENIDSFSEIFKGNIISINLLLRKKLHDKECLTSLILKQDLR